MMHQVQQLFLIFLRQMYLTSKLEFNTMKLSLTPQGPYTHITHKGHLIFSCNLGLYSNIFHKPLSNCNLIIN